MTNKKNKMLFYELQKFLILFQDKFVLSQDFLLAILSILVYFKLETEISAHKTWIPF